MFAEVIVNMPVEGTFHYQIPAEWAGRLQVGHLVEVEFGRQKAQGIILRFDRKSPIDEAKTKPILRLIDREPVVNEAQLKLAAWMSDTYLSPLSECVRLFIPPGMSKRGDVLISPVIDPEQIEPESDNQRLVLLQLARRGPLRGRQLARSFPRRDWRGAVSKLVDRGLLLREPVLDPPTVSAKQVRVAEIAIQPERVEAAIALHYDLDSLSKTRHAAANRRSGILRMLASHPGPVDFSQIYATIEGSKLTDLRALAEDDLVILWEEERFRDPVADLTFVPDQPPQLAPDQARAWEFIEQTLSSSEPKQPVLLHGVTGSGKTEIYMRAVDQVMEQGKSAIILVPEIALTPQTIRRFGARFPGRMGVVHSSLSPGERFDTWRRARSGQIDLVVGPRSALFTPLHNLGLIVIDECHDDSYKQSPPIIPPYYHTVPAAVELASQHKALVIMGSATPNVATYAHAKRPDDDQPGRYTLLELPGRIMGHRKAIEVQAMHYHIPHPRYTHDASDPEEVVMIELPPVQVIDMRQELRAGNRSIFSRALQSSMTETLERGEQAILFLNRRGTSTYVFCRECGHVLRCPNCDISLTWHTWITHGQKQGMLVCHQCDHREGHPEICPACGSPHIRFLGGGTERVEHEVRQQFPQAVPVRWDKDTTSNKGAHQELLERFIEQEANVLIGTQMIAKGLDLPLVTLVGVVNADTALHLPDFRSNERTFQLLTQVAGRAGRSLLGGQVIVQTYEPGHYAIRAAADHDFHAFYRDEMAHRREIGYPPYNRLVRLVLRVEGSEKARKEAEQLHELLAQRIEERGLVQTSLIGPAPCFYPRHENIHCWHLIVRGPNPTAILDDLRQSRGLSIDVDPVSML